MTFDDFRKTAFAIAAIGALGFAGWLPLATLNFLGDYGEVSDPIAAGFYAFILGGSVLLALMAVGVAWWLWKNA